MQHTAEIRGARFHPPAKQVLSVLAIGTELLLEPEPSNPYDPNACRVRVAPKSIPDESHAVITAALVGYGIEPEEFWRSPSIWLGYIAKEQAKAFVDALAASPEHQASLGFAPDGKPTVILEAQP